jgi:copper resistance protein B
MSRCVIALIAVTAALGATLTLGAEDHSAHQQQNHSAEASPAAKTDEHGESAASAAEKPTESESRHVPPDPPQQPMHNMSNKEMIEVMQMDDNETVSMVLLDHFEWRDADANDVLQWDAQAWYGNDYNKAWLKSEGERIDGDYQGLAELFWDRLLARWWHIQAGVRSDFGEGPSRQWLAIGVQGIAPYWFETEATVYVGPEGRTAARFSSDYDLLITQRLILQPKLEFDLYGKDDPRNGIGSGLSSLELGLRLRYEVRREIAPYVGLTWQKRFGRTGDLSRAAGEAREEASIVAGVRVWF